MAKGKAAEIVLSVEERRELESLARRRSTGQGLAQRARIVLAAADGGHNGLIADRLSVCRGTVGKWRERFRRAPPGRPSRRAPPGGAAPDRR
jgi:transposase-like protein